MIVDIENNKITFKKTEYGTRIPGPHYVMERGDLKPGVLTYREGRRFWTLTQARKAQRSGEAIVRIFDGMCVSVK